MQSRVNYDPGFRAYQTAVDRLPALEREEELELARRYRDDGDQKAADRLVEAHLRSVVKLARKFSGYGIPVAELVAEGNLGLLEAVRRFEPARGLRFLTYARYWVRAFILAYVLKHWSIVDMGASALQSRLFFRLQGEHARLSSELGDDGHAVDQQLAADFGTSADHVRHSLERLRRRDASLDAPLFDDSNTTFLDLLRDERASQEERTSQAEMAELMRTAVRELWPRLDARERLIMCDRLLPEDDAASLSHLGKQLGVTRERVRQLEVTLKAKLKDELSALLDGSKAAVANDQPCPCAA